MDKATIAWKKHLGKLAIRRKEHNKMAKKARKEQRD